MHRIFIDSDIILDILAERKPFYDFAAKLFTLIDQGKISAFTSPIVFANLHYILTKFSSKKSATKSLIKMKSIISVLPVDDKIIESALISDFSDFEDAIQYHTAKANNINFIITRNKKDYKKSIISICTAEEYLRIWSSESAE